MIGFGHRRDNMAKKLSFIIPVYNVEAYLPQCLDSILSQATEDCETILVDDGATDQSGLICDRYSGNYPDVKVVHKANGGLSSARNAGMELATGEYVCFVDSDDYIDSASVEKILRWIDSADADICFLQCDKVYPDGTAESLGEGLTREAVHGQPKEQVLAFLAKCPKYPGSAWAKLFRRAFLEENALHFPDDRRLSEDLMYCLNAFLAAEKFDVLEFPYYCYRQNRVGSITQNVNARYYFDTALFVTETAERFAMNRTAVDKIAKCALSFAAYEYSILVWQMIFLTGEEKQKAYAFLKDCRWVLKYGSSAKTKLVNGAISVLGIRLTAKLLNIYMKNR